jgi:hypothetical protein
MPQCQPPFCQKLRRIGLFVFPILPCACLAHCTGQFAWEFDWNYYSHRLLIHETPPFPRIPGTPATPAIPVNPPFSRKPGNPANGHRTSLFPLRPKMVCMCAHAHHLVHSTPFCTAFSRQRRHFLHSISSREKWCASEPGVRGKNAVHFRLTCCCLVHSKFEQLAVEIVRPPTKSAGQAVRN